MISYTFQRFSSGIIKYKHYIIFWLVLYFFGLVGSLIGALIVVGYILNGGINCSLYQAVATSYGCFVVAPVSKKILFIALSLLSCSWFATRGAIAIYGDTAVLNSH